jgi:hypothetical protein
MYGQFWSIAVVGGPIILGLALLWGFLQTRRREREVDHRRAGDDPSFGMEGAGVATGERQTPTKPRNAMTALAVIALLAFIVGGIFVATSLRSGPAEPDRGIAQAVEP